MTRMSNVANLAAKAKQKDPTNVRLGKNVRYVMQERDVNQVRLALALGLTESQVSRRITGSVDWTPADIEKTARLLNVGIERLFTMKLPDLDSNQEPIGSRPAPVIEMAGFRSKHTAQTARKPHNAVVSLLSATH